jgi:hypothetical protein
MGFKIHEYPLESLIFQDEDYYDIDCWNGLAFESKKILGSTIKAGIQQGLFTNLVDGIVPASGGGTVNFLRADGAWSSIPIAPIGGGQVLLETAVGSAVTTVAYISVHNIILGGGTWLITITGECTNNTNNQSIFTAIGVAGVYEPATGREYRTRLANAYAPFATQKIVTFVGIQTVSMMAKIVTGTGFIRNRVITALKLS